MDWSSGAIVALTTIALAAVFWYLGKEE